MDGLTRRTMIGAVGLAAPAIGIARAGAQPLLPEPDTRFSVESAKTAIRTFEKIHGGLGSIGMRLFDFQGAPSPANFLIYEIPPGGSEGVHLHNATDPSLGAYDEYYFILEGSGRMPIGERILPVSAGDHVHTPMGTPHGIENDGSEMLRVFLTYIDRSSQARP